MESGSAHPDLESERAQISYFFDCLDAMIARAESNPLATSGADRFAGRELYRADQDRLADLSTGENQICIGRIDPEEGNPVYLGKRGVRDPDGGIVVVSWQAPVVAPFHQASVREPQGLRARRRFEVEDRELTQITEDFFGPGVPATDGRPDDVLLRDLERNRTGQMTDIVGTIQAHQFDLISADLDQTLVVQGGPGTGKTVVGLHRASWLLYNHRERLERDGVLVVGPNRTFMDYIAMVLPSLGETSVVQRSFDRLATLHSVREDAPPLRKLKGDPRMAEVIAREANRRVTPPDTDLEVSVLGRRLRASAAEVSQLVERFNDGRPYRAGRSAFRERLSEVLAASRGDDPTQLRRTSEFQNAAERIWPTMTGRRLVHELLTGPRRLAQASAGLLDEAEVRSLRKPQVPLEQAEWTRSDLALIHEADWIVQGQTKTYGHVIVDEAQDLTPMEIRMVGRRARGGSLTLLGDLAQATGAWRWASWKEVVAALPSEAEATYSSLDLGYRVPVEILRYADRVLARLKVDVDPTEGLRTTGRDPEVVKSSEDGMAAAAVTHAAATAEDGGTVGLIAPLSLHPSLEEVANSSRVTLARAEQDGLGEFVTLLAPEQAKGLEFDHVVVCEPAEIAESGDSGASLLFVSLTRPTKTLSVFHARPLPELMAETVPRRGESRDGRVDYGSAKGQPSLLEAIALFSATARGDDRARKVAECLEEAARAMRESGEAGATAAVLRRVGPFYPPGAGSADGREQD